MGQHKSFRWAVHRESVLELLWHRVVGKERMISDLFQCGPFTHLFSQNALHQAHSLFRHSSLGQLPPTHYSSHNNPRYMYLFLFPERILSHQHSIQDDTDTPQVTGMRVLPLLDSLRGQVGRRPVTCKSGSCSGIIACR